MTLAITSRGTGTHNTGATTLVPGGRTATLAVGSLGILCIAADNQGSGGASLMGPATWTDAKGNVWTLRQDALYDNGAASAGIEMLIYTAPITVALLTTDLGTITWAGGVSPVAKAWTWYEAVPSANSEAVYLSGGTIAGATAANGQVVTASVRVGDGVVAGYFAEGVAAVTQDADATNGAWTAQQTATIGATTSGVRIATQQKVQTTTDSTQSYDPTVASQDRIGGYIIIREQHTAATTFTATGGGVAVASIRKGAQIALTATGAGVIVPVIAAQHKPTFTATGGGVITSTRVKASTATVTATGAGVIVLTGRKGANSAATATGGGVLTYSHSATSAENHDGTLTATGGGIIVLTTSSARSAVLTATGAGVTAQTSIAARAAAATATGAGAITLVASSARAAGLTATGGGSATASVAAARLAAALMSGGGVLTVVPSGQHVGSATATGGGSAEATGTSEEVRFGTLTATGSGSASFVLTTARAAAIVGSVAGTLAASITSARSAVLIGTGGGAAVMVGQRSAMPFSQDVVVTVGFIPGPSAGVGFLEDGASVIISPVPTAEVDIT